MPHCNDVWCCICEDRRMASTLNGYPVCLSRICTSELTTLIVVGAVHLTKSKMHKHVKVSR